MNKKLLQIIAFLSFGAAGAMYYIGNNNGHLSELLDFYYIPIPLGIIAMIVALKKEESK